MLYALIMAGGRGTRLWPLSRRDHPKQALRLVDGRTMFEHAVDRLRPLLQAERIFVVTTEAHVAPLSSQVPAIPRANFIVEPQGRGTAPAIGLGASHLARHDPAAVMAVLTADHVIHRQAHFCQALRAAAQLADDGYLVTLGIQPASPSTGYGYIKQGEPMGTSDGFTVYRAAQFIEKPDPETAARMAASGDYTWNSGMFIWRVDRIIAEFQRQMPTFYMQLAEIAAALGTPAYDETLSRIWPQVDKQTIDYGIMEHAEKVAVVPVDIGWSDIGSWTSLTGLLPADGAGNAVEGRHVGLNTRDVLVINRTTNGLVATVGLRDVVVVAMDDVVLVCAKGREQEVGDIVKLLEREGHEAWL